MKKRVLSALLTTAMVVSLAAGCGSSSQSEESADTSTESSTTTTEDTEDVEAVETRTVYVTPEWLKSAQDGNQEGYEDVLVAEVAYGDVDSCESYSEGHIPGAQYVDVCEVEDATGSEEGAYNLLSADEIEKNMLSHGITKDTKVVLYGADVTGTARVAYAYIWAGVEDVKIVNGGVDAWKEAGYDTETEANEGTEAEDFGTTVPAHPEYWTSIDDAKDRLENDDNFKLVSIRSEEEWLGETSGYNYMDKAGEPEGAVWGKGADTAFDVAQFVNDDGTVKDLEGFEEVWKDCDFT